MKKQNPLLKIYDHAVSAVGKAEAREYVGTTISLLIYDLEVANELTDQNFEKAILEQAEWFEKAAKKNQKKKKDKKAA